MKTLNLTLALPPDLLTRLLWAVIIVAAGLALYWLVQRAVIYRAQKNCAENPADLPFKPCGHPAILYFTTPDCAPCKTIQRPALRRLQERLGDKLQVVEVNAVERPDLASRWGVLSVPTTFIIDGSGQLRHVNHGAARTEKLMRQVEGLL